MIVYEVTAVVEENIAEAFLKFMETQHIGDLMATGCFESASLSRAENTFQMRYKTADRQTLDRYFAEHADRLRADVVERFPNGIQYSRQVWELVREFPS